MKRIIIALMLLIGLTSFSAQAEARTVSVKSYYKPSTGRFIFSHQRTAPNRTKFDNFSTKGNYNPYTGKVGRVNPFKW